MAILLFETFRWRLTEAVRNVMFLATAHIVASLRKLMGTLFAKAFSDSVHKNAGLVQLLSVVLFVSFAVCSAGYHNLVEMFVLKIFYERLNLEIILYGIVANIRKLTIIGVKVALIIPLK